jgi:hypothetical protein
LKLLKYAWVERYATSFVSLPQVYWTWPHWTCLIGFGIILLCLIFLCLGLYDKWPLGTWLIGIVVQLTHWCNCVDKEYMTPKCFCLSRCLVDVTPCMFLQDWAGCSLCCVCWWMFLIRWHRCIAMVACVNDCLILEPWV